MKFDCGETSVERYVRLTNWHKFFCLFPRRVSAHDCRWLEYVERRGKLYVGYADNYWEWEYRAIKG